MIKFIRKYKIIPATVGLILIWCSLNIIVRLLSGGQAFDMTDNHRYSLSAYSKAQAKMLSMPIYMTIYYSSDIPAENPVYGRYAEFVRRFLQQYRRENPGKIFIVEKNPEPYSAVEKEAVQAGVEAIARKENSNLYFGLVINDLDGKSHTIPSLSIDRSFWLEKDITSMLARFNEPERKVVGLISPIHKMIKREYGRGIESAAFIQELTARYNVLELEPNISEIPASVSVMAVIAPRKMPRTLRYALEQYVLRGGRLILLPDVLIENPYYKTSVDTISDINKLLKNWGLTMSDSLLGSQKYGKKMLFGDKNRHMSPYPLWLQLPPSTFNQHLPLFAGLKEIELRSASELTPLEQRSSDKFSLTPLITLDEGGVYPFSEYSFKRDEVLARYTSDNNKHSPAWLIEGYFQSSFVTPPETALDSAFPFIFYSAHPGKILVIGDSDFLRDDIWLDDDKLNDNGQLILRAIEYFTDNPGMAALNKSQGGDFNKPLGQRLYERIIAEKSAAISGLQNELDSFLTEQEQLLKEVRNDTRRMNADLGNRLKKLRENIQNTEERLSQYNYHIKKSFAAQTQEIIFVNLAVIPLLLLILIIFISRRYAFCRRKKIEEKYNVSR